MKFHRKASSPAAISIVSCLLLGSGLANAQEVCIENDTVIAIKGLEVVTDQYGTVLMDVDFRYSTGYEVYGSDLMGFPFTADNAEEDVFATMLQINTVLDVDVPDFAGQPGQTVYFIGTESDSTSSQTLIAAAGAENTSGQWWDPCTRQNDCVAGTAVLNPNTRFTYADLKTAVSGATCSGGGTEPPPPDTFTITPGITGTWYDPATDGEGFMIEIYGSSLEPFMGAYWYTYDEFGNPLWIQALGTVNGDTATLNATIFSGPVFGPGYNPADLMSQTWGTITIVFTSCNSGIVTYNSTIGFGTGTRNIERLTLITGLVCP